MTAHPALRPALRRAQDPTAGRIRTGLRMAARKGAMAALIAGVPAWIVLHPGWLDAPGWARLRGGLEYWVMHRLTPFGLISATAVVLLLFAVGIAGAIVLARPGGRSLARRFPGPARLALENLPRIMNHAGGILMGAVGAVLGITLALAVTAPEPALFARAGVFTGLGLLLGAGLPLLAGAVRDEFPRRMRAEAEHFDIGRGLRGLFRRLSGRR